MKVLHVLSKSFGGIRQHVAALDSALKSEGIDSSIVGPHGVMDGLAELKDAFPATRVKNPLTFINATKVIRKNLLQASIVHAHGLTAAYLVFLSQVFGKKKPLIMTFHVVPGNSFLKKMLVQFIIQYCDYVIFPSDFAFKALRVNEKYFGKCKIVTPIGQDLSQDVINKALSVKDETKKKYSINNDDIVLSCISRIHPQKDLTTLIDAFDLAALAKKNLKLLIAGTGSDEEINKLKSYIEQKNLADKISLIGFVSTPELIAITNVSVMSSPRETVPFAVVESMLMGVPMVMVETGIAKEIITDQTGSYVDAKDSDELAKAILQWCFTVESGNYDKELIIEQAKLWVDHDKNVKPLIDVYESTQH